MVKSGIKQKKREFLRFIVDECVYRLIVVGVTKEARALEILPNEYTQLRLNYLALSHYLGIW